MDKTIYSFSVKDLNGSQVSLETFRGKVLLIVNTASECGFTPQLEGLEALHKRYSSKGFSVVGFPSNDFGQQEPLEGRDILHFCEMKYHTTFPVFDKIHLKGEAMHPLFKFITKQKGWLSVPRWNFYKYLISRQGEVIDFFLPFTSPSSARLQKKIRKLLA